MAQVKNHLYFLNTTYQLINGIDFMTKQILKIHNYKALLGLSQREDPFDG